MSPTIAASSPPGTSPLAWLMGYGVLYCLLDWVSFVQPLGGTDLTAWNPQWALAVAVMAGSPGLAAPLAVTLLAAAVQPLLRHWPSVYVLESAVEILGNAVTALALRRWVGPALELWTRRSLVLFLLVVVGGAVLQSAVFAGVLEFLGSETSARSTFFGGWVGAVNIVIGLPLILALRDPSRRADLATMMRSGEWWVLSACAMAVAYTVFARSMGDQFKHFYLMFLPVCWAAARFGSTGAVASLTLVQLLLIVAVKSLPYDPQTVFELHLLLVVLGATGLLIGVTLDEQRQAERALRASLHTAASANMAAALAHELNQPLASVVSYARSVQLLAEGAGPAASQAIPSIVEVSGKLAGEALRAGDVVRRLRDFFRERGSERRSAQLVELIDEVARDHARRAELAGIVIERHCASGLPQVAVDPVQIQVVLRNLVVNALEAAGEGRRPGRVLLTARRQGRELVIGVEDTGWGVPAGDLQGIFDARRSDKAGGMGIGLAISRSIVQAHDGRLWAEPGPGGRFFIGLPVPDEAR